jgi:hypothetical protein
MATIFTRLQMCRGWKETKRIAMLGAYEDAPTGARVHEFLQSFSRSLGQNCTVSKELWLFNELCMPQLRAIAAKEAALADLVILSVHPAESLPSQVKDWIEQWLQSKGRRCAVLLALFDAPHHGDSTSMQTYLKAVAERAQIDLLVEAAEL